MALEKTLSRRSFIPTLAGLGALALFSSSATAQEISDLIDAIGKERWNPLCNDCKTNAAKTWYSRNENERQNIAQIYNNSDAYINRLTEKQKQEFFEFNTAYVRAIQSETPFPSGDVLIGQGGKITAEYHQNLPWIDLDHPTYNDRLLIFATEIHNKKRIDWNYVKRNGEHQFGDLDGPDHVHMKGETLYREGNSNIYKSKDGKHIMARD